MTGYILDTQATCTTGLCITIKKELRAGQSNTGLGS